MPSATMVMRMMRRGRISRQVALRWGRSQYAAGDPFLGLGAIARAVGGKLLPKAGAWLGRATQRTIGGLQRRYSPSSPQYSPMGAMGRIGRAAVGAAAFGGAATIGGRVVEGFLPGGVPHGRLRRDPATGEMVLGRRRRRINPTNFKALNRSLRRVESFQRAVSRSNRVLARCAPRRRASCAPRKKGR